jgi:hypothetical protein
MPERKLQDLISVGPATRQALASLGVHTVEELALREPQTLYREISRKRRKQQDPCLLDVFQAAVAQARNPHLPLEQCCWWYWSRVRKTGFRL